MKKNRYTGAWCPDSIQRSRDLWADHTSSEIARILCREFKRSFTRSSVIAKAARNGFGPKPVIVKPVAKVPPAPVVVRMPKVPARASKPPAATAPAPAAPRPKTVSHSYGLTTLDPTRHGIPLVSMEANGCRWPVSHSRPHMFCGETIHTGSYCGEHAERSRSKTGMSGGVSGMPIFEAAE